MNTYTLDPSKPESAVASAPTSSPALTPVAAPSYMPPPHYPYYPQQYPQQYPHQYPQQYPHQYPQQYPHQYPQQYPQQHPQQHPQQPPQVPIVQSPEIRKVRDWLPWSIINLFIGGLIFGLFPLIFSIVCRSRKKKNNLDGAKTMSTLALVFNVITTIIGVASTIAIFIYLFVYTKQMQTMDYMPTF